MSLSSTTWAVVTTSVSSSSIALWDKIINKIPHGIFVLLEDVEFISRWGKYVFNNFQDLFWFSVFNVGLLFHTRINHWNNNFIKGKKISGNFEYVLSQWHYLNCSLCFIVSAPGTPVNISKVIRSHNLKGQCQSKMETFFSCINGGWAPDYNPRIFLLAHAYLRR